jgi:hypothetical protein
MQLEVKKVNPLETRISKSSDKKTHDAGELPRVFECMCSRRRYNILMRMNLWGSYVFGTCPGFGGTVKKPV